LGEYTPYRAPGVKFCWLHLNTWGRWLHKVRVITGTYFENAGLTRLSSNVFRHKRLLGVARYKSHVLNVNVCNIILP